MKKRFSRAQDAKGKRDKAAVEKAITEIARPAEGETIAWAEFVGRIRKHCKYDKKSYVNISSYLQTLERPAWVDPPEVKTGPFGADVTKIGQLTVENSVVVDEDGVAKSWRGKEHIYLDNDNTYNPRRFRPVDYGGDPEAAKLAALEGVGGSKHIASFHGWFQKHDREGCDAFRAALREAHTTRIAATAVDVEVEAPTPAAPTPAAPRRSGRTAPRSYTEWTDDRDAAPGAPDAELLGDELPRDPQMHGHSVRSNNGVYTRTLADGSVRVFTMLSYGDGQEVRYHNSEQAARDHIAENSTYYRALFGRQANTEAAVNGASVWPYDPSDGPAGTLRPRGGALAAQIEARAARAPRPACGPGTPATFRQYIETGNSMLAVASRKNLGRLTFPAQAAAHVGVNREWRVALEPMLAEARIRAATFDENGEIEDVDDAAVLVHLYQLLLVDRELLREVLSTVHDVRIDDDATFDGLSRIYCCVAVAQTTGYTVEAIAIAPINIAGLLMDHAWAARSKKYWTGRGWAIAVEAQASRAAMYSAMCDWAAVQAALAGGAAGPADGGDGGSSIDGDDVGAGDGGAPIDELLARRAQLRAEDAAGEEALTAITEAIRRSAATYHRQRAERARLLRERKSRSRDMEALERRLQAHRMTD